MIVDLVGVIKSLFKTKPNGAVFGVVTESIFTQNKRYFSPKSMKIDFLEFSIEWMNGILALLLLIILL